MKISVVLPVYNVEKYLRQCLDSVINQTYKDLEIICINDASSDNSLEILKEYEKKDNRIRVINNEEKLPLGTGRIRNLGIEIATGEYIHFLDSDDWMELNAYKELSDVIKNNGAIDIVEFSFFEERDNKIQKINYPIQDLTQKVVNIIECPDISYNYGLNSCYKIFNRNFLIENNMKFSNLEYAEDLEWALIVLTKAKTMYFVNKSFYVYRILRKDSKTSRKIFFYDDVFNSIVNSFKYYDNIDKNTRNKIFERIFSNLFEILWTSYTKKTLDFKKFRKMAEELDTKIFKEGFMEYSWYVYYKDIIKNPKWLVLLKFWARAYTRKYFPFLNKFLSKLRKKTINL